MAKHIRLGFSLVEVLLVIGLTGLLIGLFLPAVQSARDSAARLHCQNNLKQIGLALHHFHDLHGMFPSNPEDPARDKTEAGLLGWMARILSEMGEGPLARDTSLACLKDVDVFHNPPHIAISAVVSSYVCPSDARLLSPMTDGFGLTSSYSSYIGIGGTYRNEGSPSIPGVFQMPHSRIADVTDGTSNTIMVGERPPPDSLQAGWWYPAVWMLPEWRDYQGPDNTIIFWKWGRYPGGDYCLTTSSFGPGQLSNPCDRYHLWSLHQHGANFLFADGSVRFLDYSAEGIIGALSTRAGGEVMVLP